MLPFVRRVNKRITHTSAQNSAYISLAVSLVTGHNFVTEHRSQAVIIRPITLSLKRNKMTSNCKFHKDFMITLQSFHLPFLNLISSNVYTLQIFSHLLLLPHVFMILWYGMAQTEYCIPCCIPYIVCNQSSLTIFYTTTCTDKGTENA